MLINSTLLTPQRICIVSTVPFTTINNNQSSMHIIARESSLITYLCTARNRDLVQNRFFYCSSKVIDSNKTASGLWSFFCISCCEKRNSIILTSGLFSLGSIIMLGSCHCQRFDNVQLPIILPSTLIVT